ncbi:MAG TPA: hypothetical protein VN493_06490 [Thermoanaerobaculia bacterium]|nr:hypothetical protein [Thermoanaerobaculia bacterium]
MAEDSSMQFYLEILKLKTAETASLQSNIVKVIGLYLAVTGALLKFALEGAATEELRAALSYMGTLVSLLTLMACVFAERYRRTLKQEIARIYTVLNVDHLVEGLPGVKYAIWLSFSLAISTLGGWSYLLIVAP